MSCLISSHWYLVGCHIACLHCYEKCSSALPNRLRLPLSGTEALSLAAMPAVLGDKVQRWAALLIISSGIKSAPLCGSIPFSRAFPLPLVSFPIRPPLCSFTSFLSRFGFYSMHCSAHSLGVLCLNKGACRTCQWVKVCRILNILIKHQNPAAPSQGNRTKYTRAFASLWTRKIHVRRMAHTSK